MPAPPETTQNHSTPTRQDKTVRDLSAKVEELQTEIDSLRRENAELRRADGEHGELEEAQRSERHESDRAEQALWASEKQLRALIAASAQVLYRMSPDWREVQELQGGEFLADTIEPNRNWLQEYIHPDDQPWVCEVIRRAIQTGTVFKLEHRVLRADGTLGWTAFRAVPVHNADGEIVEWFGAARDITERKRAEEDLIISERNLAASQAIAHVGSYSWDLEKNLLTWSDELYRILGLAPQEILPTSDTYTACIHPDDRDEAIRKIRSAVDDGFPEFNEHRIVRPDGTVRFVQVRSRVCREERGKPKLIQGVVQDITERKQTEEALRESEKKLQTLFQLLPVGISVLDEHRKVLDVNPILGDILDLSCDELLHGAYENRRYIRPDGTEMPAAEFPSSRVITEQTAIRNVDIGVEKEDGSTIWTNVSAVPLPFSDWRMLLTTSNITERKRTEEALRRRTDDLVRRSRELEATRDEANMYLDIMTHDVRNANNVSSIYADLLVELLAGDQWLYARRLRDAVQRSSEILQNVATIRRLQTETGRLVPVNLDAVIREEIGNFPGASIRYQDSQVEVPADNLLPVIFTNLIGNAVKFGEPDVEITIRVVEQDEGVLVSVEDTGPGVPDEIKERLFHRFERGRAHGRGEGLGLYICRTLVTRYGGKVWVEDRVAGRPEEGAAFKFTLPVADCSRLRGTGSRAERS
ncbi:PAS domain S-box protein [Methanoculleus taiwanensis]|uniref:PAS domain S-box protein n=1 Tax=Methanoculleus taiwanensis TaxID=1550565 RepID=UPI000FFEDDD0|nr:PAS domain S-box protein [Methanoculleus taiwanensis]